MILRKPYAFIIKHFKLLHLILTVLLGISIYRVNYISSFLKDYLSSPIVFNRYSVESYMTSSNISDLIGRLDTLFPLYVFILPLITILVTLIILFILYNKKKPYLLYIVIIVYSISLLIAYAITYSLTGDMQTTLVDTRLTNIVKDLMSIATIIGVLITIFTLIRATGFDIKRFNFVKDLQELDINEKDNEEFEVELNIDSNVIRRNIRKTFRYLKYLYIEKKFMINVILALIITMTTFIIYFFFMVHHKNYEQYEIFRTDDFTMHIDNTYITNKDYLGKVINDNYLVIIDLNVNSIYKNGKKLDISNCILQIGNNEYTHKSKYRDYLIDLGTVYNDNLITNVKSNYLLVYEIPKSKINESMIFRYTLDFDLLAKTLRPIYAKVKLNPINLTENITNKRYDILDDVSLEDSVMKNLSLRIDEYDIGSTMAEYYRFCANTKTCYDSVEYITPSVGNIDKSILKIKGKLDNSNITGVYNLYNLIEKFGKIEYKIDNKTKKATIISKINPSHITNDTYYMEIPKEVENAEEVSLKFYIRNIIYEFPLREIYE